jgi:hypothetical protein
LTLSLKPLKQTSRRKGRFRVEAGNLGSADARLELQARDEEEACRFRFPESNEVLVAAREKLVVSLEVIPNRRPWWGAVRIHDFTVTGRSPDTASIVQPYRGQYTYVPWIQGIGRYLRGVLFLILGVGVLMLVLAIWPRTAPPRQELLTRWCNLTVGVPAAQQTWPCGEGPCNFDFNFGVFADAHRELAGQCTSQPRADGQGNVYQSTTRGVLIWHKVTNRVYYFVDGDVYRFQGGQLEPINIAEVAR